MCVELVPELIDWSAIFIAFFKGNGRGERIRTSGPCLPKAVLSTAYNVKSTTYAHRSRVYVTDCDSNGLEWTPVGHIMVTGQGAHPLSMFKLIHISSPHSGGENFTL